MSDYIKRDAAIDYIKHVYHESVKFYEVDEEEVINGLVEALNALPPADVVEVRHGYWRNVGKAACQCSECDYLHLGNNAVQTTRLYKYCPNCGAYMRMTKEQYESHVGDIYEDGEEE